MKKLVGLGVLVLALGGVAVASELQAESAARTAPMPPTPLPPVAPKAVVVTISSVTLGDECGESPEPESAPEPRKEKSKAKSSADPSEAPMAAEAADMSVAKPMAGARAKRACEQTSMQLSVRSGAEASAASIKIKKVELYDEKDKLIGTLKSRGPGVWSAASGTYQSWDEKSVPGTDLSARYVLSAPDWSKVQNRWDKSYKIKVTVTVGGTEQKLERDVYLEGETTLPPGVVT